MAITIKNISTAVVTILASDYNFRRELAPGRTVNVPQDVFEQLTWESGFHNLISAGYLKVDGVEEQGMIEDTKAPTLDILELEKIIKDRNITRFAQIIPTAAPATKQAIVEFVIKYDVTDRAFTALVQKYCGVDVLKAITIAHQAEE